MRAGSQQAEGVAVRVHQPQPFSRGEARCASYRVQGSLAATDTDQLLPLPPTLGSPYQGARPSSCCGGSARSTAGTEAVYTTSCESRGGEQKAEGSEEGSQGQEAGRRGRERETSAEAILGRQGLL